MKESISYTFLLNIVIVFVFTCFAIVMGVLSYYKAFKANTIISETIEKYEGYNCLSKEEIAMKLGNIGYNTPFEVSCRKNDGKCDDSGQSYKVISYNLDLEGNLVYENEPMNSSYICDENGCATNKHYQYGIYTYMYLELPVISSIVRIPFFSKTSTMYEFRNFYVENSNVEGEKKITDVEQIFKQMYDRNYINGRLYVKDAYYGKPISYSGEIETDIAANDILAVEILKKYAMESTGKPYSFMRIIKEKITPDDPDNYRNDAFIKMLEQKAGNKLDASLASNLLAFGLNGGEYRKKCGYIMDYSKIN